jgi:hypothetical protein
MYNNKTKDVERRVFVGRVVEYDLPSLAAYIVPLTLSALLVRRSIARGGGEEVKYTC